MAKPARTFDPHSDRLVLAYGGTASGEPHISGVPARDLSEHDLCRLADIRGTTPEIVRDDLIASGFYAPANPED